MDLENMLNEIGQRQKEQYYMIELGVVLCAYNNNCLPIIEAGRLSI
jgi:hypothetical protein